MSNTSDRSVGLQRNILSASVTEVASRLVREAGSVVDGCLPPITGIDRGLPKSANAKAKPPTGVRAMTPRKLAVARMLTQGMSSVQIASALGVSRQAVWRWSREEAVVKEVDRLHVELVRLCARPAARRVDGN